MSSGRNAMLAQLMAGRAGGGGGGGRGGGQRGASAASSAAASGRLSPFPRGGGAAGTPKTTRSDGDCFGGGGAPPPPSTADFGDGAYAYDATLEAFLFAAHRAEEEEGGGSGCDRAPGLDGSSSCSVPVVSSETGEIVVPLAPCVYRMTDYTYGKKEPVRLARCANKLGVLRCLDRERDALNRLLRCRLSSSGTLEEDELGKTRFMELLSNCGVYQKVSELVLQQCARFCDRRRHQDDPSRPLLVPQVRVHGLEDFLGEIERLVPALQQAREEIKSTGTVSFFPGLGEHFAPGSKLTCFPTGMEGTPLGCQVVQCWYDQPDPPGGGLAPPVKAKKRFVLVVEFVVSVGDELVFVAASDVYPEFVDPNRNVPAKDLAHRKLCDGVEADRTLLAQLQQRGEFYASVATRNHYLEYHPNSFFPVIGGGWSNNAVRPLNKGGRVMVDVKRGILEGHVPVRATSDGMSDTVKEAIKLFEQSKRTGVAVPFRTCVLPPAFGGRDGSAPAHSRRQPLPFGGGDDDDVNDRSSLWQAWPMLTGFSFTARVWGKLLLGMPKISPVTGELLDGSTHHKDAMEVSPRRAAKQKLGVMAAGLGGAGSCGNCGYIHFQEKAFELLVLDDDKKELIRAVARNAGGGPRFDDEEDDDEDEDDAGIDVVANKGSASIFLLHGPPGCGKTLTAEGT
jgi:hypothetical protein